MIRHLSRLQVVGRLRRVKARWWLIGAVILLANYLVASSVGDRPGRPELPYTVFKQQIEAGNVAEVVSLGDIIQGQFKEPITYPAAGQSGSQTSALFATVRPAFAEPGLEQLLERQGAVINARPLDSPRSWWMNLLVGFGPTALLIGGLFWFTKHGLSGFGLGRSRARRYEDPAERERRVTFADVAGIDESRDELVEIVDFLKDPKKYTRLGGTVPKGVLLVGPPGTGKTLLARAVAGEAGVPFFTIGGSEFIEMVVGVGASRVRDLFKQARATAPAMVFIDELDSVGRARGSVINVSGRESEQTLNQILTEMDGFSSGESVIVLAATNRADVLDPALLRPGRFDRRVVVQPPDKRGREAILQVHTRKLPLGASADLRQLAASTPGLVGADLRNLVNEAALLAAKRNKQTVEQEDFLDALEKVVLGPARQLVMSFEERCRIAYHEGGHTILGLVVPGSDPVNRVTIMPRGHALGVTYQRPEDDRHNYDERYLRARIIGALGGRAAEEVVFGTRTSAAEVDLEQVTGLARLMVTRWGMSEAFGPVTLAPRDEHFGPWEAVGSNRSGSTPYSDTTAERIDREIQHILRQCNLRAVELLGAHRKQLDALAEALLERETLDEAEILQVTGLERAPGLRSWVPGSAGAQRIADGSDRLATPR